MATYQKRGDAWRVQVRLRGHTLSRTFDTREEGRIWAAEKEDQILQGAVAGASALVTVKALLDRYREEVSPRRRGERWEVVRLTALARDPVFDKPLRDFGPPELAAWRDARLAAVGRGTVNRELNLISAVFRTAIREWGHTRLVNPARLIERPTRPPPRKRRVSDDEIQAVRQQLGWDGKSRPETSSQWVAWMHAFAVETAMRRGEIREMTPDRVDLKRKFVELLEGREKDRPGQTKTGDGRFVPLSRRARELLDLTRPWEAGEPIVKVREGVADTLFRRAVKAAGIVGMRFHDSRREALTRAAPKLGNPLDLARMSGHRNPKQLLEYYQPDPADLADKLD